MMQKDVIVNSNIFGYQYDCYKLERFRAIVNAMRYLIKHNKDYYGFEIYKENNIAKAIQIFFNKKELYMTWRVLFTYQQIEKRR